MIFHEPMPDCVPEYFRERREAQEREWELQAAARERYGANRAKLDAAEAAGKPILAYGGHPACRDCPRADYDTRRDEDDDMELVICPDPACPEHDRTTK